MTKELKSECGGVPCHNQNPKIVCTFGSSSLPGSLVNTMLAKEVLTDVGGSVSGYASPTGENVKIRPSSSAKPSEVQGSCDAAGQPVFCDRYQVEQRTGTPVEMKKEKSLHSGSQSFTKALLDGSSSSAHIGVKDSSWATGNKTSVVQNFELNSKGSIKTEIDTLSQGASKTLDSIKTSVGFWNAGEEVLQQGQKCSPMADNDPWHQPPRLTGYLSDSLADMLEEGIFSRLAPPMEAGPVSTGDLSVPEIGGLGTQLVDGDLSQSQNPCYVKQENLSLSPRQSVTGKEKIQDKNQGESNLCTSDERPTEHSGGDIIMERGLVRESIASDTSHEMLGQILMKGFLSVDTPQYTTNYIIPCGDALGRTHVEAVSTPKCHDKFSSQNSPLHSPSSQSFSRFAMKISEDTFKSQLTFDRGAVSNTGQLPTTNEENKGDCRVPDVTRVASETYEGSLDSSCETVCPLPEEGSRMLKTDGLLAKCREQNNAENSLVTLARPQSMDLEEMQLKMSECRVHPDENEAPGAEIEAGTTRAFLEWDGEETVCNTDEMEQSPSLTEANNLEKVIDSTYRLLGTQGSPGTQGLCRLQELENEDEAEDPEIIRVVIEENEENEEEQKLIHWTEEATHMRSLFKPYGGSILRTQSKPRPIVNEEATGSGKSEKRKMKKKASSHMNANCSTSEIAFQTMEQVRETCLKALCDILLKRVMESTDIIVHEESVKNVAKNVERELFALHVCTNVHYKKKYRTLAFNLGDPKNKQLFRQVVLGEVTPQCLVHMSPTELASEELTEWRDKENKHALEIIKEEQQKVKACQVTKLTHKGLIEIDADSDQMLSLEDLECTVSLTESVPGPNAAAKPKKKKLKFQPVGPLLDPDCFICSEAEHLDVSTSKPTSRKSAQDVTRRCPAENAELISNSEKYVPSSDRMMVRNLLQKPIQDNVVWSGFLKMFSLKKFHAKASHVSGYGSNLCQALPEVIEAQSCILPEAVWEYVDKIWPAESKDMSIMRFIPSDTKDAHAYSLLYAYLNNKQRYGIISCKVMEAFVVPLASYQPIPAKLHPQGGPGLEESHNNLLLAVILPKKNPSDNLMVNRRPDASRKRKSVTFDMSATRKYNVVAPLHRTQNPRLKPKFPKQQLFHFSQSQSHDSWDSPSLSPSSQPSLSLSPDYLDKILNELEEDQKEVHDEDNVGGEYPSNVIQKDECQVKDPGGQEACRSGFVNVLQLLSHNIPLMSSPCNISTGTATTCQSLHGIPLVAPGFSVACACGSQGVGPMYTLPPNHCNSMGQNLNGIMPPPVTNVFQPGPPTGDTLSAALPCFPMQSGPQTDPTYFENSEAAAGANELQTVLQALFGTLNYGTQHPGFMPFVQGE
ncbi:SPOC domain-containing protein 1 isoform X3 [Lissotriton helveticus]